MVDEQTRERLRVSTDGTAGPYIMVTVRRLDDVCRGLDDHGISYSVEEDAISLDGEPEVGVIDLGHNADVDSIQAILDGIR